MTAARHNRLLPRDDKDRRIESMIRLSPNLETKHVEDKSAIIEIAEMFYDHLTPYFNTTIHVEALSITDHQTLINNIVTISKILLVQRDNIEPAELHALLQQPIQNISHFIPHIDLVSGIITDHLQKEATLVKQEYKKKIEDRLTASKAKHVDPFAPKPASPQVTAASTTPNEPKKSPPSATHEVKTAATPAIDPIKVTALLKTSFQKYKREFYDKLMQMGYLEKTAGTLQDQIDQPLDALIKVIIGQGFTDEQIKALVNKMDNLEELSKNSLFSTPPATAAKLANVVQAFKKFCVDAETFLRIDLEQAITGHDIKPMKYVVAQYSRSFLKEGETRTEEQILQLARILTEAIPSDPGKKTQYIALLAESAIQMRMPTMEHLVKSIDVATARKITIAISTFVNPPPREDAPALEPSLSPHTPPKSPTTTKINEIKTPQPDKEPKKTLPDLKFKSPAEATDFIKRRHNLLTDMRAIFTGFGFIKDFDPHYKTLQKILDDLLAVKKFLDSLATNSTWASAREELKSAMNLATKFQELMDNAIAEQEKKSVKGLKQIPSFGDHSEVFDKPKANPDRWLDEALNKTYTEQHEAKGHSKLKLGFHGTLDELKHWTENIGADTYRKTTIDGGEKKEALAEFYESINHKTKELVSETHHIAAELKTENIFFQSLKADKQFESFSKQLSEYLHENRLRENDPNAIMRFLKETPEAYPKTLTENEQNKLAAQLAKACTDRYSSLDYLDKIDTIALATINSLLAVNKNVSAGPLYINEAYSFELARHTIVAIELWNRNNPAHKINYVDNTDYNVSDFYKSHPKQMETDIHALQHRIDQVAQAVAENKGPDVNSPLAKLASKLCKAEEKYGTAEAYRQRISPQTAILTEEVKVDPPKPKH